MPAQRERAAAAVRSALRAVLDGLPTGLVALSLPTDGEVDLRPLASDLRAAGWTTLLPVVTGTDSMVFSVWDDDTPLEPNRFGIDEPTEPAPVPVADLDVVVVPAVAVDRLGHRLGFGAGFYDRTLAGRPPMTLVVAAVFSVQVVDAITPEPWDVPVDVIVTDSEVIRTPGSGRP